MFRETERVVLAGLAALAVALALTAGPAWAGWTADDHEVEVISETTQFAREAELDATTTLTTELYVNTSSVNQSPAYGYAFVHADTTLSNS